MVRDVKQDQHPMIMEDEILEHQPQSLQPGWNSGLEL